VNIIPLPTKAQHFYVVLLQGILQHVSAAYVVVFMEASTRIKLLYLCYCPQMWSGSDTFVIVILFLFSPP